MLHIQVVIAELEETVAKIKNKQENIWLVK